MSIVLITGATSGIGRHAALHLAERGHHVIATGRRTDALLALQEESKGLPLDTLTLNVTDPSSILRAKERVRALTDGHGIDVLVNNAGYGQSGAILDVDDQQVRRQFDTNVFGLLSVTRAFAEDMIQRRSGRILNVSSIGGRISMPLTGVYTSTKYAVESLSDALRIELAPLGVQVVLIEPGAINTSFNATLLSTTPTTRTGHWADVYAGSEALVGAVETRAPGPLTISKAITRAIEARSPRARYVAPGLLTPLVSLIASLPAVVVDTFFHYAFGFSKAQAQPSARQQEAA